MEMKEYRLHRARVTGGQREVEVVKYGEVGAGKLSVGLLLRKNGLVIPMA
jgi:hypothetical protein